MRTSIQLFVIVMATLLCTACGYRDALYLPHSTNLPKTIFTP